MLSARDLMTDNPVTVRPDAKLRRAAEILESLEIRHLPVVDAEGTLVGMLSDRDLRSISIPYVVGDEYLGTVRAALEAPVSSLMSADVLSVEAEADVAEIVDLMLDNKIGAVPVVDGDGELVGIVSYMDLLRALPLDGAAAAQ